MSQQNQGSVMPIIYVESVDDVRGFYVEKLGFSHMMGMVGKDGKLDFCTVVREGCKIMLSRPQEKIEGTQANYPTRRPVQIYMAVSDVNRYHDEVKNRGVKITNPLTTQWWGDRTFVVSDPYGYEIWFYENVAEPQPPKGAKIV